MWQDYVLTFGQIVFCLTLIPMLRAKEKPPLSSSIPTGILLLVSASMLFTLHLWLTAITQSIVGMQWLVLAIQKFKNRDSSSHQ